MLSHICSCRGQMGSANRILILNCLLIITIPGYLLHASDNLIARIIYVYTTRHIATLYIYGFYCIPMYLCKGLQKHSHQDKHLSPMRSWVHFWQRTYNALGQKSQSSLCQKMWVFFRCFSFLSTGGLG